MSLHTKIKKVAAKLRLARPVATLYCSFCGKSQHDVQKLVAGPSVFICDACIAICNDCIGKPDDQMPGEPTQLEDFDAMPNDKLLHLLKINETMFEHTRTQLQNLVDTLRKREVSWAIIGKTLGVSRQAAWDRFS
jgi:hypothetical protein